MTPSRSLRRAVLATVVAAMALSVAVLPARAQAPSATGWWWAGRPSSALPALVSPDPPVPEGGLYVSGAPNGATGVSALRFVVDPDATVTGLTLRISDARDLPIIVACAAARSWEADEGGGWDQRAQPDCDASSVSGTLDADQTEVHFAPLDVDEAGVLDLVLIPGVDPDTGQPASFSVALEPPGPRALSVTDPDTTVPPPPPAATPTDSAPTPAERAPAATGPPPVRSAPPPPMGFESVDEPVPVAREEPRDALVAAAPPQATVAALPEVDDFVYPATLALPLVLLVGGSYLGWALTRPVTAGAHQHDPRSQPARP